MKKKAVLFIMMAAMGMTVLGGCGQDPKGDINYSSDTEKEPTSDTEGKVSSDEITEESAKLSVKDFKTTVSDFSIDLLKKSVSEDVNKGENVLISSYSVLTDMMMATNGADGETLSELQKVLCKDASLDAFNEKLSAYDKMLNASESVKFHSANSIWVREGRLDAEKAFLDKNKELYNAEINITPFDEKMVTDVNDWVDKNTDGMIDKLLEQVPDEQEVMHLINAIAFDGKWAVQYDDYQLDENGSFKNARGEDEKASMLCDDEGSEYMHDDKATGFARPYEGYEYEFVAILPNEDVTVEEYLSDMTGESFKKFYESNENVYPDYTVRTKLPEFSYDYTTEMSDAFKGMGVESAFDPNTADFSKMGTSDGSLYIGSIVHKTHIELDKNGTRAAAVTDIAMECGSAFVEDPKYIDIYLDRPFIYAIVDKETELPLFMGVVNTLE